ncbi:MAG: DNA polymerase III subunit delta [Patescibacteria group bacterium]
MIILFYGENVFITTRKLNEALENYSKKHKSGLNLFSFSADNFSFDLLKSAVETVSMFEEKKCIILKDILLNGELSSKIIEYFKKYSIKKDDNTIVIFKEGKISDSQNENIKWLLEKPSLVYESKLFDNNALKKWIEEEVVRNNATITKEAILKLTNFCKDDLWRLSNEIAKLASYRKNISENDVSLLVSHDDLDSDIFKAIEFLSKKNKNGAINIFYKQISSGKNVLYILSMINFLFRNIIKIKALSENGVTQDDMAKMANMHPFVVKKTLESARNYSLDDLKNIYKKLSDADLKIKTSQIDQFVILDELVLSL